MSYRLPRIALVSAGLAGTAMLAACGVNVDVGFDDEAVSDTVVTESFAVEEFDQLDVGDAWTVLVTIGPEPSLEIEVSEHLLDDVEVDQDGDRLSLSMDDPRWFSDHRGTREARITTPGLNRLAVTGAASVEVVSLTGDDLDVELAGAGSVDLGEVELDRLDVGLEGASTIGGAGHVGTLTVDAEGASSMNFGRVTIDEAEIDASGASSLDLDGATVVSGRLAGASSVDVADDASVSVRTSGGSSIR